MEAEFTSLFKANQRNIIVVVVIIIYIIFVLFRISILENVNILVEQFN